MSSRASSSKNASSKEASSKEKSQYFIEFIVTFFKKLEGRPSSPYYDQSWKHLIKFGNYDDPTDRLGDGEECDKIIQMNLTVEQCALLEQYGAVKVDGKVILDILKKNNKDNTFDFILKYITGSYNSSYSDIQDDSVRVFKRFTFENLS